MAEMVKRPAQNYTTGTGRVRFNIGNLGPEPKFLIIFIDCWFFVRCCVVPGLYSLEMYVIRNHFTTYRDQMLIWNH